MNIGVFGRALGEGVPVTPIPELPRPAKNVAKREVRLSVAKQLNGENQRRVDLDIAQ